jgi:hypothetical protein
MKTIAILAIAAALLFPVPATAQARNLVDIVTLPGGTLQVFYHLSPDVTGVEILYSDPDGAVLSYVFGSMPESTLPDTARMVICNRQMRVFLSWGDKTRVVYYTLTADSGICYALFAPLIASSS